MEARLLLPPLRRRLISGFLVGPSRRGGRAARRACTGRSLDRFSLFSASAFNFFRNSAHGLVLYLDLPQSPPQKSPFNIIRRQRQCSPVGFRRFLFSPKTAQQV